MDLTFDIEDLSLGDIEDLQEFGGINVMDGIPERPPLKFLRAWVWIIGRRDNPEMTFEDARDVKLSEIGGGSQTPNDGAAPDGPASSSVS